MPLSWIKNKMAGEDWFTSFITCYKPSIREKTRSNK